MTKIGLMADVHADLAALQKALALLESKGADKILCAGDLVEKGPDGDAVVRLLMDKEIPSVMGNHDKIAESNLRWRQRNCDPGHPVIKNQMLTESTLEYLANLPQVIKFSAAGLKIVVTHGAPWSVDTYIYATSPPHVLARVVQEADADVAILGHTHIPTRASINGTHILNPGSVSPIGSHTCALLTLPDCLFEVFEIEDGSPAYVDQRPT